MHLLLAAASVLGAQSSDIIDWANNTAGRQKWAVELNSTNQQRVVCVHHKPLRMHLSLSVLELFLVQRISTNSSSRLELSTASEDTWLEGAMGGLDPLQQLERSWESARREESWLRSLRAAASWVGTAVTADSADRWSQDFSPFSSSCVALRLRPGVAEAAVEVEAKLVGPMLLSNGHRSVGAEQVDTALWIGPAVAVAALLLFWHAPALSRSLLFHYASGATLTRTPTPNPYFLPADRQPDRHWRFPGTLRLRRDARDGARGRPPALLRRAPREPEPWRQWHAARAGHGLGGHPVRRGAPAGVAARGGALGCASRLPRLLRPARLRHHLLAA